MPSSAPPTLRLCLMPERASDEASARVIQAICTHLTAELVKQHFAVADRTADVHLHLIVDAWNTSSSVHLPEPVPHRVSVIVTRAGAEILHVTIQQRPRFWRRPNTPEEFGAALAAKLVVLLRANQSERPFSTENSS